MSPIIIAQFICLFNDKFSWSDVKLFNTFEDAHNYVKDVLSTEGYSCDIIQQQPTENIEFPTTFKINNNYIAIKKEVLLSKLYVSITEESIN